MIVASYNHHKLILVFSWAFIRICSFVIAAEQKARTTYDNIIMLVDDPDILDPIKFLREREIVHFQRFGEALERTKDRLNCRNFYAINPEFSSNK